MEIKQISSGLGDRDGSWWFWTEGYGVDSCGQHLGEEQDDFLRDGTNSKALGRGMAGINNGWLDCFGLGTVSYGSSKVR